MTDDTTPSRKNVRPEITSAYLPFCPAIHWLATLGLAGERPSDVKKSSRGGAEVTKRVARIRKECATLKFTYLEAFSLPKDCVLPFLFLSPLLFIKKYIYIFFFAIYTHYKISRFGYGLRVRSSPWSIGLPGEASIISADVSRPFYKLSVSLIRPDSHQQIGVRALGGGRRSGYGGRRQNVTNAFILSYDKSSFTP